MKCLKYLLVSCTVLLSMFSVACSSKNSSKTEKETESGAVTTTASKTVNSSHTTTVPSVIPTETANSGTTTVTSVSEVTTSISDSEFLKTTISVSGTDIATPKTTTTKSVTDKETSKTTTTKKKTTTTKITTKVSTKSDQEFKTSLEKKHKIPIVLVDTNGVNITSLKNYVDCTVDVINVEEHYKIDSADAGIKVRGNSSAYYGDVEQILKNQVPYRIKFDKKTNMMGLNDGAECKSWVLLKAEWNLITNDLALRMGNALFEGQDNFCSEGQLCHVYVNKEFKGIYLLCEQTQINKNRININEVAEGYKGTDIGYLVEIDNYAGNDPEEYFFNVNYANNAYVTDIEGTSRKFESSGYTIKNDIYSQNQVNYISNYTNNVFKILYEACENNNYMTLDSNNNIVKSSFTNAKDTVNAVMDLESVVNMYILDEIVHDYDCGEGSFFMFVDFSSDSKCRKLKFTAPWDFNWAYNDQATNKYWAGAFCQESFVNQYGDRTNPWYVLFMSEEWFQDMVKERWAELKASNAIRNSIKSEINQLRIYKDDLNYVESWAVDCAYGVINWVYDRIDWLDKVWLK